MFPTLYSLGRGCLAFFARSDDDRRRHHTTKQQDEQRESTVDSSLHSRAVPERHQVVDLGDDTLLS